MTHYICTAECKGASDKPGVCQAEDCSKQRQPLEPCDCTDGKHGGRQDGGGEAKKEPEVEGKLLSDIKPE